MGWDDEPEPEAEHEHEAFTPPPKRRFGALHRLSDWLFPPGRELDSPTARRRQLFFFTGLGLFLTAIMLVTAANRTPDKVLLKSDKEEKQPPKEGKQPAQAAAGAQEAKDKPAEDKPAAGRGGQGGGLGGGGGGGRGGGGQGGGAGAGSTSGAGGKELSTEQWLEARRREREAVPYARWEDKLGESKFGRMEELSRQKRQQRASLVTASNGLLDPKDRIVFIHVRVQPDERGQRMVRGVLVNTSEMILVALTMRVEFLDSKGIVVHYKDVNPLVVSGGMFGDEAREVPPEMEKEFQVATTGAPSGWGEQVNLKVLTAEFRE